MSEHPTDSGPRPVKAPSVDLGYVELAKLAHQSFEDRRKYEWKMTFGLWFGLGAACYASAEHGTAFYSTACAGYLLQAVVLSLVLLQSVLIASGHQADKGWKHEYMRRATAGAKRVAGSKQPKDPLIPSVLTHVLWAVVRLAITELLLLLLHNTQTLEGK